MSGLAHVTRLRTAAALVLLSFSITAGCETGPRRSTLSGKVTLDGQPVADGIISLEPQGDGTRASAYIKNGQYATDPEHSPAPGSYIVRITANGPTGKKIRDSRSQEMVDVIEQYIPAKYNDASELKVEIGDDSEVAQDFALTTT